MTDWEGRRRLAWMLRVNRQLASPDKYLTGRQFTNQFRKLRPTLAPSQVTRWETGKTSVSAATVRHYEQILSLPEHSLVSVYEAVGRFWNCPDAAAPAIAPANAPVDGLHELIEKSRTPGAMSGKEWRHLSRMIQARPGLVLHPPGLWTTMLHNLINELAIAEDVAWLLRQEAMSRLSEHPAAGAFAVQACIDVADDPATPVCIEPISLLDASRLPEATTYLVNQIRSAPDLRPLTGALLAVTAKALRGHFTIDTQETLTAALRDLTSTAEHHRALNALVHDTRLTLGPRPYSAYDATAIAVCRNLALAAQRRVNPHLGTEDAVLNDLLQDALFSANPDRRLYATFFLAATPYRTALAHALVDAHLDISLGRDLPFEHGLQLLAKLRVPDHRGFVRRLLLSRAQPNQVRHAAAWASVHSQGQLDEKTWRRILAVQLELTLVRPDPLDEDILLGLVYSIGTDAHLPLLRELRADRRLPPRSRHLATWWIDRLQAR